MQLLPTGYINFNRLKLLYEQLEQSSFQFKRIDLHLINVFFKTNYLLSITLLLSYYVIKGHIIITLVVIDRHLNTRYASSITIHARSPK
jgi:hypothetical protein